MGSLVIEDLRFALRSLAKHRTFASAALLSVALGIGANTTIFSLIDALLLQRPSVREPARLLSLSTIDPRNPGRWLVSYLNYRDYSDRNTVFSSLLVTSLLSVNFTGHGDARQLVGEIASANYFSTLGVQPVVGRAFLEDEDRVPGARPVAVIGFGLWKRVYAGDPQVTSRTIDLNRRQYQIVGVAPEGFHGIDSLYAAEVWVPMTMYEQVLPFPKWVHLRRALAFTAVGRLRPGVSAAQAQAQMLTLSRDMEREYPEENAGLRVKLNPLADASRNPNARAGIERAGTLLLIVSGLVLAIACANVANLLLARGAARSKEIAVRLALGASRWRLIRQLLTESLILAALGGGVGLLLAHWAGLALWALRPVQFSHFYARPAIDSTVLLYAVGASALTGVLFGMIPAWRASRANLAGDLKERGAQPAGGRGRSRLRFALVACEIALSVVALTGASLFLRSLSAATHADPGFDADRMGIVVFNAADAGYDEVRGRVYERRAVEAAAATPGVDAASLAKDQPLRVSSARHVLRPGLDNGQGHVTLTGVVWPGYFHTVRIPLIEGRDFSDRDGSGGPRVALVNEDAARFFWPAEDAVGQVIEFGGENVPVQIVGVVRNSHYRALDDAPEPVLYLSLQQYYFPTAVVYVHTAGNPAAVAADVRLRMQALDRNVPLVSEGVRTTIRETLWAQTLSATLLTGFGLLALLMASIGVYGVVAYSVEQRVREFGIRTALGATPGSIQGTILRECGALVATGVTAGLLISLAASRAIRGMLFGVGPADGVTFIVAPAVLAAVALLACWIPALRAARISPSRALREE
ncbi:MAG: ABC transporter permease [Bryobacteraceae bacterium]